VTEEEGIAADDMVLDGLSAILSTFASIGMILGPIGSGVLSEYFNYADSFAIVAFLDLSIGLYYVTYMIVLRKPVKTGILLTEEMETEASVQEMTTLKS
jgi:MFS family permease